MQVQCGEQVTQLSPPSATGSKCLTGDKLGLNSKE